MIEIKIALHFYLNLVSTHYILIIHLSERDWKWVHDYFFDKSFA